MKVGELFIGLSIRPDPRGINEMARTFNMMRRATTGLAAVFVGGALGKGLLGFNSRMEDAKIQIAGMLALAKKTNLADQVGVAGQMYDHLRQKAAELPGETEDYVNMLGMLVQPLATAGASMADMETVTVNTMIAARGLHENWQKAGRDVSEFINFGKMNQVDTFIRRLMEPAGFEGDEGKKKLKAMTKAQRLRLYLERITQKQITQLGEAQANSFSGQMDKMRDSAKVFLGRVGLPLFRALTGVLQQANDWLKNNEATVNRVADAVGSGLKSALQAIVGAVKWLSEHGDAALAILRGLLTVAGLMIGKMIAGWVMFGTPIARVLALVTALWYVFQKLADWFGNKWVAAVVTVGLGLALLNIRRLTAATWNWVRALLAARAASAGAGAVGRGGSAAGNAINGLSNLALGPAGPAARGAPTRQFARPGAGGGGGAGLLGAALPALGTVGAVAGIGIGLYELGDAISDAMMTDEGRVRTQIAAAAMKKGASWIDAVSLANSASAADVAAAAAANNQTNNINITVNGIKDAAEITPAMIEAWEKEMRHLQVDTSGGKR